ncbi:hypothetical protein PXD04_08115 [Methanosphaera sp. ISO3-F5]|uniref:hypothetical protein n=1 Tax=Methanosphaera sp. ISO3-F5 TaxID=1452353 RepID=UPI002B25B0C9|nr:hypothetical protein [Methanosphaera sp. ISO3-F5]WQH63658.1 hypothetical protein PXD04_08115 [Methanosphaera sp. ISO3-F5]
MIILVSFLVLFSISSVNASEKISATPNDYFTYYGYDQPAAETHSFAIEVDSNVYYISDTIANKLALYSSNFREIYNEVNGKNIRGNHQFENDKYFDFEYISGQQVGFNRDAKVITNIYDSNGNELI